MTEVGDKYTFYYIEKHWTDDNENPVEFDNGDEWEDLKAAQECAESMARSDIKGTTFCLCKATHEIIEVYDGNWDARKD